MEVSVNRQFESNSAGSAESSDASLSNDKVSILLVDDRPDKLLAIKTVLDDLKQNIVTASSGMEALRLLLKQDFAVILLDVSMPSMDGFETASLIRQRARSEHTPIIFVTSINTTETHVTRGYSLGAVDYIFSPVEPEVLRAKVSVFIELFRKTEQVRRQSELLRLAAEERAASLETRLEGLLNRLEVGVFRALPDGTLLEANPAFLRLMELASLEEARRKSLFDLLPVGDVEAASTDTSKDGRDIEIRTKNGSAVWVLLSLTTVQDAQGREILEGLVEDISARKETERQLRSLNDNLEALVQDRTEALKISQEHLRRSERLASLGTLAAGIAHEINNPLNAILVTAKYAMRKSAKVEPGKALSIICDEAIRGGQIVKGILKFAKEEKVTKAPADLNEVILQTRDLTKAYLPNGKVSLELELAEGLPPAYVNSTAIEQVLVNLISNAAEASEGSATIRVRTNNLGDGIGLEVEDDGPGIPEDTLQHIFDPFFSTKRSSGGTGLGLSICHGIVTEHGGTISVASEVGRGTRFSIKLPYGNYESAA